MKHRVHGRKLNRDSQSRRALFKNLIRSLIEHFSIQTTLAKAKAIQSQFDHLMVKAQRGTLNDLHQLDQVINDRRLVNRLIKVIVPVAKDRKSGFTRIIRLKDNRGDNALIVRLSLTDLPQKEAANDSGKAKTKATAKTKTKTAVKPNPVPPVKLDKPIAAASAAPISQRKTP